MNIIHMKYAVEVAKAGSINKASENLSMAQPNISRAIKDLEAELGIAIFDRSAKGMNLTSEGKEFIEYSQKILNQLNDLENIYKNGKQKKLKFSISVAISVCVPKVFSEFFEKYGCESELIFKEADTVKAIKNVLSSETKLGLIRYAEKFDGYFKETIEDKGLCFDEIFSSEQFILTKTDGPLSNLQELRESDLEGMTEIIGSSHFIPHISPFEIHKDELHDNCKKCVVTDSLTQLEILANNENTFMRSSALDYEILQRFGLSQLKCVDYNLTFKNVLIYKKGYKFTDLDRQFIESLKAAAK